MSPSHSITHEDKALDTHAKEAKHAGTKLSHYFNVKDLAHDAIIGFSDGLTVPFALTAGLSSLGSTQVVVIGGLAELFAGSISMGLGAWLAVVSEEQYYASKEMNMLQAMNDSEKKGDVSPGYCFLQSQGVSQDTATRFLEETSGERNRQIALLMKLVHGLERPNSARAWISALTMGIMYFLGGIFPMIPYFVMHEANKSLFVSIGVTVAILLAYGWLKSMLVADSKMAHAIGALQTLAIGVIAAGASYGIVKAVNADRNIGN